MKKFILPISFLLLVIACVFIYKVIYRPITPGDLIIQVRTDSLIKTSEDDIANYYNKNEEDFKKVADYLLANEKIFMTRPVILNKNNSEDTAKISDADIKETIMRLIEEGMVSQISSLSDEIKNVHFMINSEYGVYEQGIRYTSDVQTILEDKTKYNYAKEYTDLGNGWYYYLYYYNDIKDADVFRKLAWDALGESDRKSIQYDWHKAIVSLEDWDLVAYKADKRDFDFVVSVCFNTDVDGLLGPIMMYFDPDTKEIVGGNLRF